MPHCCRRLVSLSDIACLQEHAGASCEQLPFFWLCAQIAHMAEIRELCEEYVDMLVPNRVKKKRMELFPNLLICFDEAQVR